MAQADVGTEVLVASAHQNTFSDDSSKWAAFAPAARRKMVTELIRDRTSLRLSPIRFYINGRSVSMGMAVHKVLSRSQAS
jgi:hypothetical protein